MGMLTGFIGNMDKGFELEECHRYNHGPYTPPVHTENYFFKKRDKVATAISI